MEIKKSNKRVKRICHHCGKENIYFERYIIADNYRSLMSAVTALAGARERELSKFMVALFSIYDKCLEREGSYNTTTHWENSPESPKTYPHAHPMREIL